jgi:nitroreductase
MHATALELLLGRYSVGARHLAEPGPDDAQLALMVQAALRAPDHGGLVPYRFAAIRGAGRAAFAGLLEQAAQDAGKAPAATALDRERALRSPLTLAVIARIDPGHPLAPVHEQWIAIGGAVAQLLAAAQALGFAGKMLSGAKVRSPRIVAAFCAPGESLVGWIDLGTPQRPPQAKHTKPEPSQVLQDWNPR